MARSATRIWLWWTAIVVYCLVGLAPSRGLVLCIGDDGHFALEVATSEASCFDCLPASEPVDGCCTDADDQGSSCSCSDILLFVDNPRAIRAVAPGLMSVPLPPSLGANSIEALALSSRAGSEHRARSTLPPGSRIPTHLILRV